MPSVERRACPRYRVRPQDFAYFDCLGRMAIRDLSRTGVYVEDPTRQYPQGTELEMEILLGREVVPVRGVVMRTDPGEGFAVRFLEAPPDIRERMETYFSDLTTIT